MCTQIVDICAYSTFRECLSYFLNGLSAVKLELVNVFSFSKGTSLFKISSGPINKILLGSRGPFTSKSDFAYAIRIAS